ncbi:MAG: DEAD/DEAH box helicase [Oscillospiraceae bacterium]|nr:DEAD/DEAH box helicase [Oscillospiraceae bacterium]
MEQGIYRYFDVKSVTEPMHFTEAEQARGQELVRTGQAQITTVSIDYEKNSHIHECIGRMVVRCEDGAMPCSVSIQFGRRRLFHLYCSAARCRNFARIGERVIDHHPCIHKAAALLLLRQYLDEHNPGDTTNADAMTLMQAYHRNTRSAYTGGLPPCIRLVPYLERNAHGVQVGFRIGTDRLYVLRDLYTLRRMVEGRQTISLGKQAEVDFSAASFDGKGMPFYRFLCEFAAGRLPASGKRFGDPSAGKLLTLEGACADALYDAAQGMTLTCTDRTRAANPSDSLEVCEGMPDILLKIRPDLLPDGTFEGVCATASLPLCFSGSRSTYCITAGNLLRIPDAASPVLRMLTDAAHNGQMECHFGRRHLSDFWYSILPDLRRWMRTEIGDEAQIRQYLPPDLLLRFDLDAQEGFPRCRITAVYDTAEYCLSASAPASVPDEISRDAMREAQTAELVRTWLTETDGEEYVCTPQEEAVYRFLHDGLAAMHALGEVRATDAFSRLRIHRRLPVKVGVSVESHLLRLEILSDDLTQEELLDIIRSYRMKKQYHRLNSGTFVELDDRTEELSEILETLQVDETAFLRNHIEVPVYRALYLDRMLERCEEMRGSTDTRYSDLVRAFQDIGEAELEVPESLRSIMRSYQCYGHKWMRTLAAGGFGGILADDMGLGKTLQMISVLLAVKENGTQGTSIIICPSSLVYNWIAELERFAPALHACAVAGTPAERAALIAQASGWDVLVTSYDLLKRDIHLYEETPFLYEVLDEAQYIKNRTTDAAKAVKLLRSMHRFALTGTPIENRLSELWSIFDFLMPGFLYDYPTFRRELDVPITHDRNPQAIERLRRMTAPFILRRLKTDVLQDLPEKLEEVRYARFESDQQHVYDGEVIRLRELLQGTDPQDKIRVLAELTRIRLICCDPGLVFEGYQGGSAKREACLELIRSAMEGGHRILVFSSFTSMLALLEQDLTAAGIGYYKIIGDTPKRERLRLVNLFNEGDVPVFLISIRTGGNGLNLTGADVVIHYDPWWSAAVEEQASDRAHRMGQKRTVTVYRLIASGTLEERIRQLQERKLSMAQPFLGGESELFSSLTREELLGILGG